MDWDYCECGCHTCETTIAGRKLSYLMRWPLASKKEIYLNEGFHRSGKLLGTFDTLEDMDTFLATMLDQMAVEVKAAKKGLDKRSKERKVKP